MEISALSFFAVVILGILPSVLWLLFYLRKDVHPEPREIIFQLFFLGFLIAPLVGIAEFFLQERFVNISQSNTAYFILFIMAAFWEEGAKYLTARSVFHHQKEFDELTDAMIYLITVALGFAASENIIIGLSSLIEDKTIDIVSLIALRGAGATFLHTVASGMVGYFLARQYFLKKRFALIKGLASATFIHALFNWFILKTSNDNPIFIYLIIILLVSGFAILLKDFHNLRYYDEQ